MRIVHLEAARGPRGEPSIDNGLTPLDDRWVACLHGRDVHLHDLAADPRASAFVVEQGGQHTGAASTLLTFDAEHGFRRFSVADGRWCEVARFGLPAPFTGWPADPRLSPSGRFVCVELPAYGDERHPWVVLLDAHDGRPIAAHARHLSARASFATLAGREILYLSAPSYMGVLMLDAASGRTLHAFEPAHGWDFCHTDYALTPDGARLVVFGCVWAAPYELRLYDATPWTGGSAQSDGFPLPQMFAQVEAIPGETVLPAHVHEHGDGTLDVYSLIRLRDVAAELEELDEHDRPILAALRELPGPSALLQRRVDLATARVVGWTAAPIRTTCETHVHALPGHRAVLVGAGVQLFDGRTGVVREGPPLAETKEWFLSAITADGETVLVRTLL